MTKSTFFHLSEEKQRRLLEAASIEFSRIALKEASIANIIKLAEIPRGSFYQYFEDKEDLYYYYFDLLSQDRKSEITKCVQESDGDLFDGIRKYFSKIVLEALSGHMRAFINIFIWIVIIAQWCEFCLNCKRLKRREKNHKKCVTGINSIP